MNRKQDAGSQRAKLAQMEGHGRAGVAGFEKCGTTTVQLISSVSQKQAEDGQADLDRIYARISKLAIPLFLAISILNHLDRTNLAFAALTLNADLGFNAAVYGLGSSLFFVGFVSFQVPSNLILLRVGARIWLSLLLVAWGAVATSTMFIHNKASFYTVRILLGVFEAGAFPGMWYYLSLLYPSDRITKPYAWLTIGILLANVLGAPLAAGLLSMDGLGGLQGWQWLFLVEGIPAIVLGGVVLLLLPSTPQEAHWLTEADKKLLAQDMARKAVNPASPGSTSGSCNPDATTTTIISSSSATNGTSPGRPLSQQPLKMLWIALQNPLLYYLAVCGFLTAMAAYTMIFWLPIVINGLLRGEALTNLQVAAAKGGSKSQGVLPVLLAAIPYTVGAFTTWLLAHSSQKRKELFFHTSIPLILAGVCFAVFAPLTKASMAAGFISLVLVVALAGASNGVGISLVGKVVSGPAYVVAMPLYNCCANVGGFVGPMITGRMVQAFGGFGNVSILMGILLSVVGVLLFALRWIGATWLGRLARSRCSSTEGLQSCGVAPGSAGEDMAEKGIQPTCSRSDTAIILTPDVKERGH